MSEISDRCRNFAALVRAWAAFELSGPVPARLDYDELANTLNLAADEIVELETEATGKRRCAHNGKEVDMTDAQVMRIAERLCTAMGYQWPCNFDRYSVKVSQEAVTKYWIELAEHAIDAYENERVTHTAAL